MANPGQLEELVRAFVRYCQEYPTLSIILAFGLLGSLVLTLWSTTRDFWNFIAEIFRNGSKSQQYLATLVLMGMVIVPLIAPTIVRSYLKPRPIIDTPPGKILAKTFTVAWTFAEDNEHKPIKYEVSVEDRVSGKRFVLPSASPFTKIEARGRLSVKVRATAPNWTSPYSDEKYFEVYDDSVQRMKALNELTVLVHPDYSDGIFCFNSKMTADGYEGFDIDLIELIKKELASKYGIKDLQVNKVFAKWPEIIEKPSFHEADFAIASISIKPERTRKVDFSVPYYRTEIALIRPKTSIRQLNTSMPILPKEVIGLVLGAHKGTTAEGFSGRLEKLKKVKLANDNVQLFEWLTNGDIDGALYDYARSHAEIASHPEWVSRKFDKQQFQVEQEEYGITFAKVNVRLREDINNILRGNSKEVANLLNQRVARINDGGSHMATASLRTNK